MLKTHWSVAPIIFKTSSFEFYPTHNHYIWPFLFSSCRTLSAMTVCMLSAVDLAHGARSEGRWRWDFILSLCSTTSQHKSTKSSSCIIFSITLAFVRITIVLVIRKTCMFCGSNLEFWSPLSPTHTDLRSVSAGPLWNVLQILLVFSSDL